MMKSLTGMPGLIGIDHIGIAVFDLDKAIEWYMSTLGANVICREVNDEQMIEEATLKIGNSHIQLITPKDESSIVRKFLSSRGQGLQQMAFQVSNLEIAMQFAVDHQIRVVFKSPRIGTAGSKINFLHPKDCFGVLIELVERINYEESS
jgi:methylmalonyl-CoA/ethylmalonyl-CoA epimerase